MTPLEKLFVLEIEFHRRLRALPPGITDAESLHTSYALATGYEQLLPAIGPVTDGQIEQLRSRFAISGDSRAVLAASDSLKQLLQIPQLGR
jgi:hypothetical protein